MMSNNQNPWVDRFLHLNTREKLQKALDQKVAQIESPFNLRSDELCNQFRSRSRESFYPTKQCIDIAERIVVAAQAHACTVYSDKKSFIKQIYDDHIVGDINPIAITSLAGVGKSSLLRAIARAIGEGVNVTVDDFHPPFPILSPRIITIQERISLPKVMQEIMGGKSKSNDPLLKMTKKFIHRKAIPLILVDEFQFLATSQSANTLIAKLLLGLSYIGLPWVYAANFSLMAKLIKRPEEEKQRILADVIVMEPDHHTTDCWKNTIAREIQIAPELFELDVDTCAKRLHEMTAGRKRALVELLVETIRVAIQTHSRVNMSVIEHTYKSQRFSIYRTDSELINNQIVIGRPAKGRSDLWCPEQIKPFIPNTIIKEATENRIQQAAQQELYSAMSPEDRKVIKNVEKTVNQTIKPPKANVIKMPTPENSKSLLESTMDFLNDI